MYGKQIILRSLLEEDSEHYFRWINDRQLVNHNANYKPVSEFEHEKWFNTVNFSQDTKTFSIVENKHFKLIGSCSLRAINHIHRNAELQIRIGEYDFQNKGLGTEAINLLVDFGFNDLNLKRIYLHVFSDNFPAIRAYEKCDFQYEGLLRKAAFINGKYIDINIMSVINDSKELLDA